MACSTACERLGTAFVPYFPLESGLLTGKYRRDQDRPDDSRLSPMGRPGRPPSSTGTSSIAVVERLITWCAERATTPCSTWP